MLELNHSGVLRLVERDVCDVSVVLEVFGQRSNAKICRRNVLDQHTTEGGFIHWMGGREKRYSKGNGNSALLFGGELFAAKLTT